MRAPRVTRHTSIRYSSCEQFHLGRSFDLLVINVCNDGEHYETPCIFCYQSVINAVQPRITFFWQLVGTSKVTLSGILITHYLVESSILFFITLLCDSEEHNPNNKVQIWYVRVNCKHTP